MVCAGSRGWWHASLMGPRVLNTAAATGRRAPLCGRVSCCFAQSHLPRGCLAPSAACAARPVQTRASAGESPVGRRPSQQQLLREGDDNSLQQLLATWRSNQLASQDKASISAFAVQLARATAKAQNGRAGVNAEVQQVAAQVDGLPGAVSLQALAAAACLAAAAPPQEQDAQLLHRLLSAGRDGCQAVGVPAIAAFLQGLPPPGSLPPALRGWAQGLQPVLEARAPELGTEDLLLLLRAFAATGHTPSSGWLSTVFCAQLLAGCAFLLQPADTVDIARSLAALAARTGSCPAAPGWLAGLLAGLGPVHQAAAHLGPADAASLVASLAVLAAEDRSLQQLLKQWEAALLEQLAQQQTFVTAGALQPLLAAVRLQAACALAAAGRLDASSALLASLPRSRGRSSSGPQLQQLDAGLAALQPRLGQLPPSLLVQLLHSLGLLEHRPLPGWLDVAAQCADAALPELTSSQLAQLAYAMAKLGPAAAPAGAGGWDHAWLQRLVARFEACAAAGDCSGDGLSNLLWALVRLGPGRPAALPPGQLDGLLQACSAALPSASPQGLSTVAWALAKLQHAPPPVWLERYSQLALEALPQAPAPALCNIAYGLSRLGYVPSTPGWMPAFLDALQQRLGSLTDAGLCTAGWALLDWEVQPSPQFLEALVGAAAQAVRRGSCSRRSLLSLGACLQRLGIGHMAEGTGLQRAWTEALVAAWQQRPGMVDELSAGELVALLRSAAGTQSEQLPPAKASTQPTGGDSWCPPAAWLQAVERRAVAVMASATAGELTALLRCLLATWPAAPPPGRTFFRQVLRASLAHMASGPLPPQLVAQWARLLALAGCRPPLQWSQAAVVQTSDGQLAALTVDALAGLASALGAWGHELPESWLDAWLKQSYARMASLGQAPAQALALLSAAAALRVRPSAAWFQRAMSALEPHLGRLDAPALLSLLACWARLDQRPGRPVMKAFLDACAPLLHSMSRPQLLQLVQGLAQLDVCPSGAWMQAGLRPLLASSSSSSEPHPGVQLEPAQAVALLAALARLQHRPDDALAAAWLDTLAEDELQGWSLGQLAAALDALLALRMRPPRSFVAALLHAALQLLPTASDQDVAQLLQGLSCLPLRPAASWLQAVEADLARRKAVGTVPQASAATLPLQEPTQQQHSRFEDWMLKAATAFDKLSSRTIMQPVAQQSSGQ